MNKSAAIVAIIGIIVIGGAIIYANREKTSPSEVATSTGTQTQASDQISPPPPQTPQPGAPTVTTDPSKITTSDTTVVVTGSITPNGAFTSYWYEYGISAEFGSKTSSQTLGSGYVAIAAPAYITGLTKDTKYYFRLVGENQYGRVNGATATFQTTVGTPAPTGSAPTTKTLAAMSVSRTTANLNGEVTPNKAETQYWFEFGKTTDLGNTSAFQSAGSGSAKVPVAISISNLEGATTYYFRLNAQNQFGTVNGAIMNFKTPGPPAPTKPTVETRNATDVSTSTVLLHGRVNPNGAETQYWFEYSTDSLLGSLLLHTTERTSVGAGSTSTSVEADVEDLTPKTNYYFRMVAENNLGLVYGERMSFKTK